MNLNKILLIGNLTRDPELRYTSGGAAMVNFTLATNHRYTTSAGETKDEACFIRVTVWGKIAENCGKYLGKGSPVFVEGRLRQNNWETDEGEKRSKMEVVAQSVQFLGQRDASSVTGADSNGKQSAKQDDDLHFDDDDLPF